MSFVAKHIVGTDERVVLISRLHWVYLVQGVLWAALFCAIGLASDLGLYLLIGHTGVSSEKLLPYIPTWVQVHASLSLLVVTGLMIFYVYLLKYVSTEIVLTTNRLVFKTGLWFVEVEEIALEEVCSETVHHGVFGRFFDYGWIFLDMRFVNDVHLPVVSNPYRLIRGINRMREGKKSRASAVVS